MILQVVQHHLQFTFPVLPKTARKGYVSKTHFKENHSGQDAHLHTKVTQIVLREFFFKGIATHFSLFICSTQMFCQNKVSSSANSIKGVQNLFAIERGIHRMMKELLETDEKSCLINQFQEKM